MTTDEEIKAEVRRNNRDVEYYCVNCKHEFEVRNGSLYHPRKRRAWFSYLAINCQFAGMYFEHPDCVTVKKLSDPTDRRETITVPCVNCGGRACECTVTDERPTSPSTRRQRLWRHGVYHHDGRVLV